VAASRMGRARGDRIEVCGKPVRLAWVLIPRRPMPGVWVWICWNGKVGGRFSGGKRSPWRHREKNRAGARCSWTGCDGRGLAVVGFGIEFDFPKKRLEAKIQPSAFTQVLPKTLRRYGQQGTGQAGCGRVRMMLGGSNPNSILSPAMEPGTEGTTGCGLSAREIALQCGFQPPAVEQKRARRERGQSGEGEQRCSKAKG